MIIGRLIGASLIACFVVVHYSEEEAAEVKKSKLYRPASKFSSPPQNTSPVQPAEVKKTVSDLL